MLKWLRLLCIVTALALAACVEVTPTPGKTTPQAYPGPSSADAYPPPAATP